MKAIVRKAYGGTEQLAIEHLPDPVPAAGEVLIRVKAFGVNRAEIYMRRGLWGDVAAVSGIECVGEVEDDPSGSLAGGKKVAAIMGGMGRTRNGSYAEKVTVPASNVMPLETDLDWADLATIPESYATAWSCLHENMYLRKGNAVLIRGGTSALGQAAINIAANIEGVVVMATTRRIENAAFLKKLGCTEVFIESGNLSSELRDNFPGGIDCVMDIIGNTTLLDSLKMAKRGGYVCNAGFLGGGDPIRFSPLTDMPAGVNLNLFASFMFGTDEFPLATVPMQSIVDRSASGIYKTKPTAVFDFEQIAVAHQMIEENRACGKIVVAV